MILNLWDKKIAFTVLCILLTLILIIIISSTKPSNDNKKTKDFEITIQDTRINELIKPYITSDSESVEIFYVKDNVIYGSVIDSSKNGDLFKTNTIFSYYLNEEKIKVYNFEVGTRVFDFYTTNNTMYLSTLSYTKKEGIFNWQIIKYNNSKKDIILEGLIDDPFNAPIFIKNKNSAYLITKENSKNEVSQMFKIEDDNIIKVNYIIGNSENMGGKLLYSMYDIIIQENKLIYSILQNGIQSIISYDIENNIENELYSVNSTDKIVNNLVYTNNHLYFTEMNKNQEIDLIDYNLSSNNYNKSTFSKVAFGSPMINNNYILYHSMGIWNIYSIEDMKLYKVKFPNIYAYPKFFVINDTSILFEGDYNKIYIGTINLKEESH